MPNKRLDPLGNVAAQVVADDPKIRARVKRLVNALIDDAEYLVEFGAPNERIQLMKQVVPGLLRSMQGADMNAEEAEEHKAYERMMATLRGEVDVA